VVNGFQKTANKNVMRVKMDRDGKSAVFQPDVKQSAIHQDANSSMKTGVIPKRQMELKLDLKEGSGHQSRKEFGDWNGPSERIRRHLTPNRVNAEPQARSNSVIKTGENLSPDYETMNRDQKFQESQADFFKQIFRKHSLVMAPEHTRAKAKNQRTAKLSQINNHNRSFFFTTGSDRLINKVKPLKVFSDNSTEIPAVGSSRPTNLYNHQSGRPGSGFLSNSGTFSQELVHSRMAGRDQNRIQTSSAAPSTAGLIHKRPLVSNSQSGPEPKEYVIPKDAVVVPNQTIPDQNMAKELSARETRLIANQVFKMLEERIVIEKDRRGLL
jgi:hypothetical protein